ncbi:centrosomal protein of 131 kDa isoform X2 [Scaptodrosophila lebanonensis]|uniref:Centrosomal protein of 131 kDa isoform X2 n=1 Tax=Drosophila lebanonensis TaxID=7225 RepID=A0A6J2TZH7_DROLE|nr:centrosomal protein of 131 kDa isoform X2 [Scaptodrosophila lebanonensis]
MDLCLKGSQINLATREQTKPKYTSRSLTTLHQPAPHFRPRSANFLHQRNRSSLFLGRPQSADPKFGRLSVYFSEKELRQSKQRNQSSTDLLKSLLEQPIKRNWLCRSAGNSSTDEQSDFSQKTSYSSFKKPTPESGNSNEGEEQQRLFVTMASDSAPTAKCNGYAGQGWAVMGSNLALSQKSVNPDLPGRVSFSKANLANEVDSSDCENDKQGNLRSSSNSISAPGPLTFPSFVYSNNNCKSSNNNSNKGDISDQSPQKKSVHFRAPAAGSSEVLAETYEYPKCPSEICTCSTRSSSTTSTHEAADVKCACDSHTCRYTESSNLEHSTITPELKVIQEYKRVVDSSHIPEQHTTPNNHRKLELPNYLEKYAAPTEEKQNNLSEPKNIAGNKVSDDGRATLSSKADNKVVPIFQVNEGHYGKSSADAVISNYMRVSSSPPFSGKKKEDVGSAATALSKGRLASGKLKKAVTMGGLREERSLSEYNLDKVDSWMSIQEVQKQVHLEKLQKIPKHQLEDLDEGNDSASQLSMKSNDDSRDSTYEEIVSVIKEIEEDKKQDNFAEQVTNELNLKLESCSEAAEMTSQNGGGVAGTGDKYKDILTYLNNVESSCDKTLMETRRSLPNSSRSEVEFVIEPDVTDEVPKLSELLMLPNHQLARRVIGLSLRANELTNAIHLSKEHVVLLRSEKQKLLRAEKSTSASKLREQKKHYEEVVKRHQGFIEQLLKDKGSLCEKVAALTRRLESQNQAWEHRLETELARAKETTLAGEKIRRERWVRENTKKIKELTVKGLEVEINKMNCDHQRELTELKRAHQMQLLDALEEARLKHEQIELGIRESCTQDRESIIEKERTAIRERFERQLEEEQKTQAENRQKLCDEFAAERERLQAELRQKDCDYQTRRQEAQMEQENELEQVKFEMQEKLAKQEEKYQNRINTIEKQYLADFELWKNEYENNCKLAQAEKENSIRQHYRAERDRQLDELVVRMEADALQIDEEHEQKLLRLKEKYEKDLNVAESVEKSLREKYAEIRGKLAEAEAEVRNCQAEVKQLQLELGHSKKMCGDILSDRDKLRENLSTDIQNELGAVNERHKQEMEQLQKRVHQTIERQEETIEVLKSDNDTLRQQCLKLNAVIRQQRKDYCVK